MNLPGDRILEFGDARKMVVANRLFRKWGTRLVTNQIRQFKQPIWWCLGEKIQLEDKNDAMCKLGIEECAGYICTRMQRVVLE